MSSTVAVLGAGMVGVSCALELQRRGHQVTLVDRLGPGRETSYGNAGVLARSSLILATHGSPISVTCRHSEHEQIIDLLARGERQAGVAWMAEHFEHITRGLRWREQPLDLFSVLKGGDTPT